MSTARVSEGMPSKTTVSLPDGVRLHVEEYGDPTSPLTVVLLHGWTLDARLWRRQVTDLPTKLGAPLRILTFDLRGHGHSTACPPNTTTLAQLADDLHAVLRERVPTGKVVLAGHSMGGMTIMEYAHRHGSEFTERVAGVALMCTTAEGTAHTTYGLAPGVARVVRALEITGAALLARSGPWRLHRTVMPVLSPGIRWLGFGRIADPAAVRLTIGMIGNARLAAIGGFRPWIEEQRRVDALVHMATLPAAVLVGGRDRITPSDCADTIVAALPGAEHVICPDAGHMLPLECPDEVTGAIARVCQRAIGVPTIPPRTGSEEAPRGMIPPLPAEAADAA
ncbi:MAG: alpha/beta hydrolase [Dactylosporangium sp.]|jgi:pimeloyl-ACP methyl ester carboxylesterase|nr:alpha/beta hydrolase [Dactylosporangium sp.]